MREEEDTAMTHLRRLASEQFLPPSSPLRVYHHPAVERVDVHWHEFYEMHFIVAGAGTHLVNGVAHPLVRGSCFLLTPADFHAIVPHPGAPLELYNVIFSDDALTDEVRDLLFGALADHIALFDEPDYGRMEAEFRRLWEETSAQQPGYRRVVQGALERILIDLARRCPAGHGRAGRSQGPDQRAKVHGALIHLHHHFREDLTLERVAAQSGLSPHYFSTCFHAATGTPFQTYLCGLRLRFARVLLQVSELPVTEICHASGFGALSHFERAFKHAFGQSPRAYRRNRRDTCSAAS